MQRAQQNWSQMADKLLKYNIKKKAQQLTIYMEFLWKCVQQLEKYLCEQNAFEPVLTNHMKNHQSFWWKLT